jgi:hypothetical protein
MNLYVEMLRVLDRKPLETLGDLENTYFDSLHQQELQDDFLNLVTSIKKEDETFDRRFYRNLAYVSLRLPGIYDGTDRLFGFEFRTISRKDSVEIQEKLKKLMDTAQYAITNLEYGIPIENFYLWIATQLPPQEEPGRNPLQFLNNCVRKLYYDEYSYYSSIISIWDSPKALEVQDKLTQATQSNNAIPMLTHSWAEDPLLLEAPEVQKHVQEIQKQAFLRISAGEKPAETLIYFLKKSGLFRIIEHSLGLQEQSKNPTARSHQSSKVEDAVGGN